MMKTSFVIITVASDLNTRFSNVIYWIWKWQGRRGEPASVVRQNPIASQTQPQRRRRRRRVSLRRCRCPQNEEKEEEEEEEI